MKCDAGHCSAAVRILGLPFASYPLYGMLTWDVAIPKPHVAIIFAQIPLTAEYACVLSSLVWSLSIGASAPLKVWTYSTTSHSVG